MPRIRTLKPEHRQHRKVGQLSDRAYRLWVGMILEADDEGRLVAEVSQLTATIFPYQRKVKDADVQRALVELSTTDLLRLYSHNGTQYAWFPSWHDHQKIDRPRPSKLPTYEASSNDRRTLDDASTKPRADLIRSDLIGKDQGSEGKGGERGGKPIAPRSAHALSEEQDRARLEALRGKKP